MNGFDWQSEIEKIETLDSLKPSLEDLVRLGWQPYLPNTEDIEQVDRIINAIVSQACCPVHALRQVFMLGILYDRWRKERGKNPPDVNTGFQPGSHPEGV